MGTHLMAQTTGVLVFSVVVAAVVCSLTLSVAAQRQGDCTSKLPDGRLLGHCIPIRQCAYFMEILSSQHVTQADRNLLRDNRCNNQQEGDVHVCCPLDSNTNSGQINGSNQSRKDFGVRHPLLPRECGTAKWQRLNTTETNIKEYPWLVLIEYNKPNQEKLHACGGVLISDRYVLTAAHCVTGRPITDLGWLVQAVRLGEWDTMTNPDCQVIHETAATNCAPPFQDVAVEAITVHPHYVQNNLNQTNDIAIIRLGQQVQLNDFVQPICLPNKQMHSDELADLVTEVAGWQAKSSSRMKKSEVIITSIEECQKKYATYNLAITSSQLCGAPNANECHGNSGGPLMLFKNDVYMLGGLLSFGPVPCPNPGWPDIYTRIASYIDWIHENLKP